MAAAQFDILMRLDTSSYSAGARRAAQDTAAFGSAANKATAESNAFASSLKTLAGFLAGIGLFELGKSALNVSADFDDALTQINTLVGESTEQISEWRGQLLRLGPELGKGPVELAKALYTITGAGARGAEALDVLTQSAKASALGMGDTQTVAKAVVAAMEAYGRGNLSAADATEILRNAVRSGNAEASTLAPTLGQVTGIAASMGVSFSELTGFVAKFTKAGGSAAEGVTALRGILAAFLDGAGPTKQALESIEMSLDDVRASIRERGLAATLVDLQKQFGGNTSALAELLPRVEGLAGLMNVIAADSGADYLRIVREVGTTTGDLSAVFDQVKASSPGQALRELGAIGESLQISLGDGLAQAVLQAVTGFGDLEQQQIAAKQIGEQLGHVVGMLVNVLGVLADNTAIVRGAFEAWVAVKAITWAAGLISALGTLLPATVAQTAATQGQAATDVQLMAIMQQLVAVSTQLAASTVALTAARGVAIPVTQGLALANAGLVTIYGAQGQAVRTVAVETTAMATAQTTAQASSVSLAAGLGVVLAAVLAINAAIVQWSATMQHEIDFMVGEAARFAKALGDTKLAAAAAIASNDQGSISAELAKQRQAYAALAADARKFEQELTTLEAKRAQRIREGAVDSQQARKQFTEDQQKIQTALNETRAKMGTAGAAVKDLFAALGKADGVTKKATSTVKDFSGELDGLKKRLAEVKKLLDFFAKGDAEIANYAAQVAAVGVAWSDTVTELELVQEAIANGLNPLTDMTDGVKEQLAAVIEARRGWEEYLERIRDARGETLDMLDDIDRMAPTAEQGIRGLAAAQLEFQRATALAKIETLALNDSARQLLANMGITIEELTARVNDYYDTLANDQAIDDAMLKMQGTMEDTMDTVVADWTVQQSGFWAEGGFWSELMKEAGGILTSELGSAFDSWVESAIDLGDSFGEKLVEGILEQLASAAFKSAIANVLSGLASGAGGAGFWGGLVSAFTGSSGGGGGGGGGYGWIGTLATAYKAWQKGAPLWGGLTGTTVNAGTGGLSASAATTQVSNGYTITTGSAGSTGSGGLSAGATSLATAAGAAAIIYALNTWLEHLKKDEFFGVGQSFSFGQVADPTRPSVPWVPPGGTVPGGGVGGAGDNPAGGSSGGVNPGGGRGGGVGAAPSAVTSAGVGFEVNPTQGGIITTGGLAAKIGFEAVQELLALVEKSTIGIVESLGGVVTGLGSFVIEIDNQGKHFKVTTKDGVEKIFDSWQEAIDHGITSMLAAGSFEGLTDNIETVLAKANTLGLEGLDAALALAKEADDALAGKLGGLATGIGLFEQQAAELETQLAATLAEGRKLGLTEESLAALMDQRRHQLEMEQALVGGQALTSLLGSLFEASAAAAGDAELAARYTYELGAIRIAQLEMEAAEFYKLGYITAEVFNRIQGYITALDPSAVGERLSPGGWSGGGATSAPVDTSAADQAAQEAADRAARKAELEAMVADMALGLGELAAQMMQRGRDIRATIAEMNELEIDPALIEQFWQLSKGEAIRSLLEGANKVIADAGRSDLEQRRAELDAFWDAQILAAYQLGAELGVAADELLGPIRDAQRLQRQQLAEDAVGELGLPLEQTRQQAKKLTDALAYLRRAQAEGAISAERFAEVLLQTQAQTEHALLGMAAGLLEQTGNAEAAAEARARMAEIEFDVSVAQLRLFYQMALAAGALTEAAQANLAEFLAWLEDPANRPDFTVDPAGPVRPPAANDNDPREDLSALRQSVLDQIAAWRALALDPVTRQARELSRQLEELRANARRVGIAVGEVDAAFAIARADFIRQQLAPYANLADPLGAELDAIRRHFDDVAAAFREIGASAADMARLEEARQDAITAFYERVDQQAQTLLDRLTGGDLATGTKRQKFETAQTEFQALAARLAANPQDLEARAGIAAAGERLLQAAQAYNSGALYNDMAAVVQQVLMNILGGSGGNVLPFPVPPPAAGQFSGNRTDTHGGGLIPRTAANDVAPSSISPAEQRTAVLLTEIRDGIRTLGGLVGTGNADRRTAAGADAERSDRLRRTVDDRLGDLPLSLARALGGRR